MASNNEYLSEGHTWTFNPQHPRHSFTFNYSGLVVVQCLIEDIEIGAQDAGSAQTGSIENVWNAVGLQYFSVFDGFVFGSWQRLDDRDGHKFSGNVRKLRFLWNKAYFERLVIVANTSIAHETDEAAWEAGLAQATDHVQQIRSDDTTEGPTVIFAIISIGRLVRFMESRPETVSSPNSLTYLQNDSQKYDWRTDPVQIDTKLTLIRNILIKERQRGQTASPALQQ